MEASRLGFHQLIEHLPEKFIEVAVLHVLKDHDEGVAVHAHAVELHYVIVLEVGQQLGLTLEVLPGGESRILQSLKEEEDRKPRLASP